MELKIQKWGNSSAVRLSASVLAQLGVQAGDSLEGEVIKGKLVLQAAKVALPKSDAAVAAMQFAIGATEGMEFLQSGCTATLTPSVKSGPKPLNPYLSGLTRCTNQPESERIAMSTHPVLRQTSEENYVSLCGYTMQREYGLTPNGNPMNGRWVLRKEGVFIDFNRNRNDLAEQNNIKIDGSVLSVE